MVETLNEMGLEYLLKYPESEALVRVANIIMKLCPIIKDIPRIIAYKEDDDKKVFTVLTFEFARKIHEKGSLDEFTSEDWADIAVAVDANTFKCDGRSYSIYIFGMYAKAFEGISNNMKGMVPDAKAKEVRRIAEEIRKLEDAITAETFKEADYTEKCLWLCLEGVIKVLMLYVYKIGKDTTHTELAESITMLAFEYARHSITEKENELLTEYIDGQRELDEKLKLELDAYTGLLKKKTELFKSFMEDSWSDDHEIALSGTAKVARYSGILENEIIDSRAKADEIFGDLQK